MKPLLLSVLFCCAVLELRASPQEPQAFNADREVARVKKQLQQIQTSPISKDEKVRQQRTLLDRETANAKAKLRVIQNTPAQKTSADAKDHAQRLRDAIVDFLQKLSSINPQLK